MNTQATGALQGIRHDANVLNVGIPMGDEWVCQLQLGTDRWLQFVLTSGGNGLTGRTETTTTTLLPDHRIVVDMKDWVTVRTQVINWNVRARGYDVAMSDFKDFIDETIAATETLYWDVEEEREKTERQLLFALRLWHDRNENYARIAEAVRGSTVELRNKARKIKDANDRRESLRGIGRIFSIISFLNEYAPYVEGSGGQRPAPPSGKIRSVTPGGLPGMGKRR